MAFAPRENPEIVLAVLLEGGEHGGLAAPTARDIIKAYFDKKVRLSRTHASPRLALIQKPGQTVGQAILSPVASTAASTSRSVRRTTEMARYRSFRDLDWSMLVITLIICCLGILQIYSATQNTKWSDAWWKQGVWVLVAIGIMWVASSIDYHTLLGQVPDPLRALHRRAAGDVRIREAWYSVPAAGSGFPGSGSTFRSRNSLNW